MTRVLVTAPFPSELIEKLRTISSHINLEQMNLPENRWPNDARTDAEVLYAFGGVPRPEQSPNLHWIQTHWAGVDHLREEPIWDSDVLITTASGIHAPNLGQYVLAQMLAWANRVPRWLHYQRRSEWPSGRWVKFVPDELRGKTLGILGYGSVGREVARLASAFGMTILATKRDARRMADDGFSIPGTGDPSGEMAHRIYPSEATRSMVVDCDYVVIALPLTAKTRYLIDESILRVMKPSCYLINVGRGAIIRESDLVKALKKGWIAGAGLDVFESEPLASDNPLWSMENVILSPHVSGFTPSYDERAVDLFGENLRRYLAGEPLLNPVNREQGY